MNTINNIHNAILKKIESGAIRQKPKWHFVLLTLGIVLGALTLALILLYLISFVALIFKERLFFEALSFGPGTVFAIMHTLPLLLVVLVVTVLLVLHVLVRYFAFAYMKPVLVTFGTGFVLTLVVFAVILFMDDNSNIAQWGEKRHIPGVEAFHTHFRDRVPPQAVEGTISKIEGGMYFIEEDDGMETAVLISDTTKVDKDTYEIGDVVMVLAEKAEDSLRAIAIRIYDPAARPGYGGPPRP